MRKWIFRIAAGLVGLILLPLGVVFVGGMLTPREHLASSRAVFRQPPETIWATLEDMEGSPSWRLDIQKVERHPDRNGHPVFLTVAKNGDSYPLELTEALPPSRLVTVIADPKLPFGGSWTYELSPADGGTSLTITESGWVEPLPFRFLARYAFGLHSSMDLYLTQLGQKFGDNVEPEHVR